MSIMLVSCEALYFLLGLQQPSPSPVSSETLSSSAGATVAKYALMVSGLSFLISIVTAYFQFRAHRAKRPVMLITMSNLPPYTDDNVQTVITIKNVGTAATTNQVGITVFCSWMPFLSYKLNLPTDTYCLEPNEEYWWRFRMDDRVVPNSIVVVTVRDAKRDSWKWQEQIYPATAP
jgi:hypothetical protein